MPLGSAVASVFVEIGADSSTMGRGFDEADRKMGDAERRLMSMGKGMESAGRTMTRNLTLPIVAGFALAARESINFESAMAGVAKTIDMNETEFAAMSQGIRDMAKELPASREEIAAVAEAAGQLGISKDNILSFTRTMIDLGESTNLTADEAATMLAQFANITQMPQGEFAALGDTLVALGNAGASTEADILALGQRLAASGTQAGLTQAQILGLASAMADVGINAEMGGTSMSQVLNKMRDAAIEGGPPLEAFAETAGMTAEAFGDLFAESPEQAIAAFVEGLARITAEGGTMTPVMEGIGLTGDRVRDTLSRLAGAGDGVADSFARATDEFGGGALMEEAARRYETTGARMEMAWNQITDAAMEVGDVLVPIISQVASGAATWAQAFGNLPGPVLAVFTAMATLLAITGPFLFAGGKAVQMWVKFGQAMPGAEAAVSAFAKKIGVMISSLVKAHPAIAAVVAGIALLTAMFSQGSNIIGGPDAMGEMLDDLTDSLMDSARAAGSAEGGLAALIATEIDPALASELADLGVSIEDIVAAVSGDQAGFDAFLATLRGADIPTGQFEMLRQIFPEIQEGMEGLDAVGAEEALAGIVDPAVEAAEAVDELTGAIDEYLGTIYGVEESRDALTSSFQTLFESLVANGSAFRGTSAAAMANREAMRGLVSDHAELISSMIENGASQEAMQRATEGTIGKLRQARNSGLLSASAFRRLRDDVLGVPTSVGISTSISGVDAVVAGLQRIYSEAQRAANAVGQTGGSLAGGGSYRPPSGGGGGGGRAAESASLEMFGSGQRAVAGVMSARGAVDVTGGSSSAYGSSGHERPIVTEVYLDGEVVGRSAAVYLDQFGDR